MHGSEQCSGIGSRSRVRPRRAARRADVEKGFAFEFDQRAAAFRGLKGSIANGRRLIFGADAPQL